MPTPEANTDDEGRGGRDFRTTHWSVVLNAADSQSPQSLAALEELCRAYWFPLYAYVRRQGHGPEQAADLTQDFFVHLLRSKALGGVDPAKGRFRSFLLVSLKNLLANQWDRQQARKRGGGETILSLDAAKAEEQYQLEPVENASPDKLYERRWAAALLDRVMARLEEEYGKHPMGFANLVVFLVEDKGTVSFTEMAARLSVTEAALKSVVYRARRRYAQFFREEIANTVADPQEVDDEIQHLLRTLREQ